MAEEKYKVVPIHRLHGGKLREIEGEIRFGGKRYVVTNYGKPVFKLLPLSGREIISKRRAS